MTRWAFLFVLIALITGAIALIRVEWIPWPLAWILFGVFLVLSLVSLLWRRGPPM